MRAQQSTRTATLRGIVAIVLWAGLATLTTLARPVPPFQLAAMTFAIAAVLGLLLGWRQGVRLAELQRVPIRAWVLGIYGLLGFHACYFFSLSAAPAVEANLINYTWPLLIVVMSGLLPASLGGGRLRWWHLAGALLGFAGTVLLLGAGERAQLSGSFAGYAAAFASAFIWSSYSVASRLFPGVPNHAVTGYCAGTALGALGLHLALETTVWPAVATAWLAIVAAGVGPVGLAFFLWDDGVKHGHIRVLGVASYATPLLSTLLLNFTGQGQATASVWLAAVAISAGALVASRELLVGPNKKRTPS
ncbi:MAG: EamA family transporter [Hyphomicrobiaceae bacterium]|nr:EamA family transporter [Hyphomicrobiaceae bacterium]